MSERILVVGAGAIGGIVAAHLRLAGHEVTVLTTNPVIGAALRSRGFRLLGRVATPEVKAGEVLEALHEGLAPFGWVVLATQPPQVEEAARAVLPWLAAAGRVLVLQNGLCEERIARIAGPVRTLGAVVAWGATMREPGVYERTSSGGFTVGSLAGSIDEPAERATRMLSAVAPTKLTRNLRGVRWSKLALNAMISTLGTIGGDTLGNLVTLRAVRRLGLEILTEAVDVACAEGVALERVSGTLDLRSVALAPEERKSSGGPGLVAKHALLLAVGARYRKLRSSMLSAIERGRPPAVDFLNGEIVERGRRHGVATPVNAAARELVWRIARGEVRSAVARLEELYAATAAVRGG